MKFSLVLAVLPALVRAGCEEDCVVATVTWTTCVTTNCAIVTAGTCPDNCQPCFDEIYAGCGGCSDFDTSAAISIKPTAENLGCSPASTTMMAAAALLASTTAAVLLA
ncbi:hypothetical protein ScalyP_jg11923 [Parmales sp. scaly parma]|nr:hypothetical protein ScalyP_jg11923 [Parmales sp. scaly parma]